MKGAASVVPIYIIENAKDIAAVVNPKSLLIGVRNWPLLLVKIPLVIAKANAPVIIILICSFVIGVIIICKFIKINNLHINWSYQFATITLTKCLNCLNIFLEVVPII